MILQVFKVIVVVYMFTYLENLAVFFSAVMIKHCFSAAFQEDRRFAKNTLHSQKHAAMGFQQQSHKFTLVVKL